MFKLGDINLRVVLHCVFEIEYEVQVKLAGIGGRRRESVMDVRWTWDNLCGRYWSRCRLDWKKWEQSKYSKWYERQLRCHGTEKEWELGHMFYRKFVNNQLSVGYKNGESFVKSIFEAFSNKTSALALKIMQPCRLGMQLFLQALMFLENCIQ